MPDTFIKIASVTVGAGGASSISFSSIPSTYTDIKVLWSARLSSTNFDLTVDYNGSNGSLTQRVLYTTNGTSVTSEANAYLYYWMNTSNTTASTFSNGEMYIPNYAGSNNKSMSMDFVVENNATAGRLALQAGLRSNTAALTSLTFTPNAGTFEQYSTMYLYGIKNS